MAPIIPIDTATASPSDGNCDAMPTELAEALQREVMDFRQQPATPQRTFAFEQKVAEIYREAGRVLLEQEYNRIEPEHRQECPVRLRYLGQEYKRRPKSRNTIGTLFGEIELRRYLYEPLEAGERAIFPLELQLGIEAGLATPALAERVGFWSAEQEQAQVLTLLREHGVSWSVASLRKVAASLRDGMASFREDAQVAKVLEWLAQADRSRGRHRPVLAAGRDGIHVPMRSAGYHEGATATLSVLDRRGKRVGTIYLGQMPESGQGTLTAQLTALLGQVLAQWHAGGGRKPRLEYITDGGHHPKEYHNKVLRHMPDPSHLDTSCRGNGSWTSGMRAAMCMIWRSRYLVRVPRPRSGIANGAAGCVIATRAWPRWCARRCGITTTAASSARPKRSCIGRRTATCASMRCGCSMRITDGTDCTSAAA